MSNFEKKRNRKRDKKKAGKTFPAKENSNEKQDEYFCAYFRKVIACFQSNFKIWGDVQPGRIGNMSLHSRHIHDGIITAVQNEAEIFPLSPLIQQIRADKTHEERSSEVKLFIKKKNG